MSPPVLDRRHLLAAPLALACGGAARSDTGRTEAGPLELHMRLSRRDPGAAPTVALTLDACPGGFDERIARVLIAERIPATLFVTGLWMRDNPAPLALLLAHLDLFALENHGARHIPPVLGNRRIFGLSVAGDLASVRREAEEGAAEIASATGRAPLWYRGAAGYYSPTALPLLRHMGLAVAGFSLNADMGASLPARSVARRIAAAGDGEVIVAHINQPHRSSGAGVAEGILALKARGARFLRLDAIGPPDVVYG